MKTSNIKFGSIEHFEKMVKMAIAIDPEIKEEVRLHDINYWIRQVSHITTFNNLTRDDFTEISKNILKLHS